MENLKKKQKNEWRELSREELKSINGGSAVILVVINGKLIAIEVLIKMIAVLMI